MSRSHRSATLTADRLESARDAASERLADAADWAGPRVAEAREKLAPHVESALGTAKETLQDQVAPKVAAALAGAAEKSAPARKEAKLRGEAALAALRGEVPARQRRWPGALLFLALGALAGAAASVFARRPEPQPLPSVQPFPPVTPAPEPPLAEEG